MLGVTFSTQPQCGCHRDLKSTSEGIRPNLMTKMNENAIMKPIASYVNNFKTHIHTK